MTQTSSDMKQPLFSKTPFLVKILLQFSLLLFLIASASSEIQSVNQERDFCYFSPRRDLVTHAKGIRVTDDMVYFRDDTVLVFRCPAISKFKLIGKSSIKCINGRWSSAAPVCQELRVRGRYSPPVIYHEFLSGDGTVAPDGTLVVKRGSNIVLKCLWFQVLGMAMWTKEGVLGAKLDSGWNEEMNVLELRLPGIQPEDEGNFTCTTSYSKSHSINIKVVGSQIQPTVSEIPVTTQDSNAETTPEQMSTTQPPKPPRSSKLENEKHIQECINFLISMNYSVKPIGTSLNPENPDGQHLGGPGYGGQGGPGGSGLTGGPDHGGPGGSGLTGGLGHGGPGGSGLTGGSGHGGPGGSGLTGGSGQGGPGGSGLTGGPGYGGPGGSGLTGGPGHGGPGGSGVTGGSGLTGGPGYGGPGGTGLTGGSGEDDSGESGLTGGPSQGGTGGSGLTGGPGFKEDPDLINQNTGGPGFRENNLGSDSSEEEVEQITQQHHDRKKGDRTTPKPIITRPPKPRDKNCRYSKQNDILTYLNGEELKVSQQIFKEGTELFHRCSDIGKLKFSGSDTTVCVDGLWTGDGPACQRLHPRSRSTAPVIEYEILDAKNYYVTREGLLSVPVGATVVLKCLWFQKYGQPEWIYNVNWKTYSDWNFEGNSYNLEITNIQTSDEGHYVCKTPHRREHGITLQVRTKPDTVRFEFRKA